MVLKLLSFHLDVLNTNYKLNLSSFKEKKIVSFDLWFFCFFLFIMTYTVPIWSNVSLELKINYPSYSECKMFFCVSFVAVELPQLFKHFKAYLFHLQLVVSSNKVVLFNYPRAALSGMHLVFCLYFFSKLRKVFWQAQSIVPEFIFALPCIT